MEATSSPSKKYPRFPTPEHLLVTLDSIFLNFPHLLFTFPHLLRKQRKCSSVSVMTWGYKAEDKSGKVSIFPDYSTEYHSGSSRVIKCGGKRGKLALNDSNLYSLH